MHRQVRFAATPPSRCNPCSHAFYIYDISQSATQRPCRYTLPFIGKARVLKVNRTIRSFNFLGRIMPLYQLKKRNAPEWLVSLNGSQTPSPPLSPTAAAAAAAIKKNLPASELAAKQQESREKKISILSTLYSLNISRTKSIVIGLYHDTAKQSFSPMAQLTNTDFSYNIYMDNATWSSMQNHFNLIADYFDAPDDTAYPSSILVNSVQISFKRICGAKAVVFTNLSCPLTVRNLNKYGIIMHKKTFNGLMRTSVCADERFRRISAICAQVNKCKELMKDNLALFINTVYDDDAYFGSMIHDMLTNLHCHEISTRVKKHFVDERETVFVDHYFDVVYLELALNPSVFVSEIKKCKQRYEKL